MINANGKSQLFDKKVLNWQIQVLIIFVDNSYYKGGDTALVHLSCLSVKRLNLGLEMASARRDPLTPVINVFLLPKVTA